MPAGAFFCIEFWWFFFNHAIVGMGERADYKKVMLMLDIPLKTSVVLQHKVLASPVNIEFRTKYERDAHRYEECLFLTQSDGRLIYTTCTGERAIQSWENVDFKLPYSLALNLSSVSYKLNGDYVHLEIPTCTLETIGTLYDKARPKYIRDSDLQTRIAAVNGKRVNMEMINPGRFVDKFDNIVQGVRANQISDPMQYQWFLRDADGKIDCSTIGKIYKIVLGRDVFEYEYVRYSGEKIILGRINDLHRVVDMYGVLERATTNGADEAVFNLPVAIFKKAQQTIIWPGIAQRVK